VNHRRYHRDSKLKHLQCVLCILCFCNLQVSSTDAAVYDRRDLVLDPHPHLFSTDIHSDARRPCKITAASASAQQQTLYIPSGTLECPQNSEHILPAILRANFIRSAENFAVLRLSLSTKAGMRGQRYEARFCMTH
jgi:hypothetical protein